MSTDPTFPLRQLAQQLTISFSKCTGVEVHANDGKSVVIDVHGQRTYLVRLRGTGSYPACVRTFMNVNQTVSNEAELVEVLKRFFALPAVRHLLKGIKTIGEHVPVS